MEQISKEQEEAEMKFIMVLGIKLRNIMITEIAHDYAEIDAQSRVVYNLMANFICNTIADISPPNSIDHNIEHFIFLLEKWKANEHHVIMKYNHETQETHVAHKEDLH